ncbi:hypothetical protein BJ912DRAFT_267321 [Pholiota molesta]|nr:hypothetical protein BJ912DRAFT_267321 [Pholiota molesta]
MDARRLNTIQRRQLGLPLTDLFPTPKTSDASSSTTTTSSSSSATSTSTSLSTTSSTSTTTSSSTKSSVTTSTTPTSSVTPTPVVLPSSNTVTVTETASASSTTSSPSTTAVVTNQSFLENKAGSGVVFGLVGLVGLVLIIMGATFFIRRRRSNKLLKEALSFDPVNMGSDGPNMAETGRGGHKNDRSSSSTGYASHVNGPLVTPAPPFSDYALPPVSYTPTSILPQGFPMYTNSQQRSHPTGAQQYAQSYDWTAAPAYQNAQGASNNQGAPDDEKSRRSGSSSGEFQFAAVTAPLNVSSARR